MRRYHRRVIRKCSVGLWHGSDCFHAYSSWCPENFTIHDIHTKRSDYISQLALRKKVTGLETSNVVDICYAGRLDPMKAPLDWLKAIAVSRDLGAPIRAVWYGDGPLRNEAEAEISRLKLSDIVRMPGFVSDRGDLLAALRKAHMMLFTHITPESPRCLIEALLSGTPIVGYESRFADDLTDEFGGGSYVPTHDWENLGRRIASLATDRPALIQSVRNAARSGERFNDAAVFEERSRLVKQFA
jgi:glycosyltransferase involved in cell wall biosynthesis